MLKKLSILGLLAACSLAQAEVKELKVIYEGFYNTEVNTFQAWRQLTAYFNVDDLNQDGTYSLDEVVEFRFSSIYYGGSCGDHPVIWECLSSFTYTPGSNPSFTAGKWVSDEYYPWHESIVAGEYYEDYSARWGSYRLNWTDETKTWVLPADATLPVPEPSQYVMLTAGLAGMLALARRRRLAR